MDYRHELKFLVSEREIQKLHNRLREIMEPDSHQKDGGYTVRSLYFDDIYDSCLEEVLSGVDDRQKYRIRLYNGNTEVIHLERKSKKRGMTRKESESLTADQCRGYLDGVPAAEGGILTRALFALGISRGMAPCCIVEYERAAYVEETGNVRITFDTNIRGTAEIGQFLEPVCRDCAYVLPEGIHILEVKYDEFLPEYILQALDLNCLARTSFSKYAYVRTYTNRKENHLLWDSKT